MSDGTATDEGRVALHTEIKGKSVYLVNTSAVRGMSKVNSKTIVGATKEMISQSVYMWKMESVTRKIKIEVPITSTVLQHPSHLL